MIALGRLRKAPKGNKERDKVTKRKIKKRRKIEE